MRYLVWCPEQDEGQEDGRVIKDAFDSTDAAEQRAEQEDWSSAEYAIVAQRSEPVVVVRHPDGSERRFRVTGEAMPVYCATELIMPLRPVED